MINELSFSTGEILGILQRATPVSDSAQLNWTGRLRVRRPRSTCHACFSFAAWFVGFDVLHNIFTVRGTISPPTTLKHSQVSTHQINTARLSFVANSGCHSNDCAELTPNHSLSHVLEVQYRWHVHFLLQSTYQHQQLNIRSVADNICVEQRIILVYCIFSKLVSLSTHPHTLKKKKKKKSPVLSHFNQRSLFQLWRYVHTAGLPNFWLANSRMYRRQNRCHSLKQNAKGWLLYVLSVACDEGRWAFVVLCNPEEWITNEWVNETIYGA